MWSLFWFFVNIILLLWVFDDAKRRHGSSVGCLWTFVVLIFGVFGLIAYVLFGRDD